MTPTMPGRKLLKYTPPLLLFLFSAVQLPKGISDPDCFRHLKTGEWICN